MMPTGDPDQNQAINLLMEVARDMPGEVTLPEQTTNDAAADWRRSAYLKARSLKLGGVSHHGGIVGHGVVPSGRGHRHRRRQLQR